jgi:hypothetical protein
MWCGRLKVGDQWKVEDPPALPVSHGICPDCLAEHHPEDAEEQRRDAIKAKVAELKERQSWFDEQDWQYWELKDLMADLTGGRPSITYCRPASLQAFLDGLPAKSGCVVCGDTREPDGWLCLGCGTV